MSLAFSSNHRWVLRRDWESGKEGEPDESLERHEPEGKDMLGLAEEDTTSFHAFHKEVVYLLCQGRIRSQRTVDWNIENPSIGQTAEGAAEKAEHLPGEGLQYYDTNDLRSIRKRRRDNGDDHLSARSVAINRASRFPYGRFSLSHV
jgi:hypothetical protein